MTSSNLKNIKFVQLFVDGEPLIIKNEKNDFDSTSITGIESLELIGKTISIELSTLDILKVKNLYVYATKDFSVNLPKDINLTSKSNCVKNVYYPTDIPKFKKFVRKNKSKFSSNTIFERREFIEDKEIKNIYFPNEKGGFAE